MNSQRPAGTLRRTLLTAAVLVSTVPLIGASCLSTGDDTTSRRNDRNDRDDRISSIPSDAKVVAQGTGDLTYRSRGPGRLYVYDATDRTVRYTLNMVEADTFAMNAGEDRVYVNGQTADKVKLEDENRYRLYFQSNRSTYDRDDRDYRDRDSRDRDTRDTRDTRDSDITRPVPDTAKTVDEARGRDLSFKADDDGRAYLYDASNDKLIQTYTVRRGQRLTVSPANDAVSLDGKPVRTSQNLDRRTTYRLLFSN
jgi:hypothetical protein